MSKAKHHIKMIYAVVFVQCLLLIMGNAAYAEPYLQLDASPAVYVVGEEDSTVTTSDVFTLYALVNSKKGSTIGTFYISVAIHPKLDTSANLGSFIFAGTTVNVTTDMVYGVPPIATALWPTPDPTLPTHGAFPTYFTEFEFTNPSLRSNVYDVQTDPGLPTNYPNPSGDLYYETFLVDATSLDNEYNLHIDLYTRDIDGNFAEKAPFSHDVTHAPVPGALLLGMLGMSVAGMKLRKYA